MKKRKVVIMRDTRWSDEQNICYTVYVVRDDKTNNILTEGEYDELIAKYKKKKDVLLYERDENKMDKHFKYLKVRIK